MIFMRLPISKTHACRQDGACSGKSAIHRGRQCPNLLKNHHAAAWFLATSRELQEDAKKTLAPPLGTTFGKNSGTTGSHHRFGTEFWAYRKDTRKHTEYPRTGFWGRTGF